MDQTCSVHKYSHSHTHHSHALIIHMCFPTHMHLPLTLTCIHCSYLCTHILSFRHTLTYVIHTHLDVPTDVYTETHRSSHSQALTIHPPHVHSQALTVISPHTDMHSQHIPTHFCIIKALLYTNAITYHTPTHICTHIPQHTPLLHMYASLKALLYTCTPVHVYSHTTHICT